MALKPILFNTEMVKAILDGRKTQTRRIVRPKGKFADNGYIVIDAVKDDAPLHYCAVRISDGTDERDILIEKPFMVGDILWVRETWHRYEKRVGEGESCRLATFYGYKASIANSEDASEPWKPSIHMPKEAARIFLKVKDVRVELLQDIKPHECVREGAVKRPNTTRRGDLVLHSRYITEFETLWNSTIKPADRDVYGWDANPWVWVIEFERCEKPKGWC